MRTILKAIGEYLLYVLLPRTCAHCREDLLRPDNGPLCAHCRAALEPLTGLCCKRCGLPLASGGELCRGCRGRKHASPAAARSAFLFNPEMRSLIHAFKYRGRTDLAEPLGRHMASVYDRRPELKPYNFALYVPLHQGRERERGFNQSELLARVLAREKKLFLLENTAERVENTPSQTGLSKEERRQNVQGAFRITKPELIRGRRILIIDDVATTLATANELAKELKKAGAKATAIFTLAREA